MPAIVCDHEEPDEQAGGGWEQDDVEPELTQVQRDYHRTPDEREGDNCDGEFENAARQTRLSIAIQSQRQISRIQCRAMEFDCQ